MQVHYFLEIIAPEPDADLAQALLADYLPQGWQEETLATGETRFLASSEDQQTLNALRDALLTLLPQLQINQSSKPAPDWSQAWKQFFTPVPVGRFLVLPPWLAQTDAQGQIPILIEPRSAFGTGHHPSTTLCLRAISELADQGRLKPGQHFLDLGTGSGILALACAKLGLSGLAVDIDPQAIQNTRENLILNQIDSIETAIGNVSQAGKRQYDLVLANILANPLKEMAEELMACKALHAPLVLSGFLEIQAPSVAEAYAALGRPQILLQDGLSNGQNTFSPNGKDRWACLYWI